jgi:SAM-dependent methyltransferase
MLTDPGRRDSPNTSQTCPLPVRAYYASTRLLANIMQLVRACHTGFWLGVLGRKNLHWVDQVYYDRQGMYRDPSFNQRGLWPWEQRVLDQFFSGRRTLLVAAAGGGREVLALRRAGFDVRGFECNSNLAAFANRMLGESGLEGDIEEAPRDHCPVDSRTYDGAIVGWGAYMLIQGRARRLTFLGEIGARLEPGGVVLLSFFDRPERSRRFATTAALTNAIRWLLRRDRVEVGDVLNPNYVHCFTQAEIRDEVDAVGFDLIFYSPKEYAHAVARKR